MKHKFTYSFAFLLIIAAGCSKSNEVPEIDIVGKWKLIEGETVFNEHQVFDYSDDNIIYQFHPDGTLTIKSDIEGHIGHGNGEYSYMLSTSPLYKNADEPFTLTIGTLHHACSIAEESMILNDSPLDGPILHFIRQ